MAVSLVAGAILGLAGGTIAQIFAWIGVGAVVYAFALSIGKMVDNYGDATTLSKVEMSEEELAELIDAFNDEGKDDVD